MKAIKKVGILSLGCPRNLVDSESILGRINAKGYPVVDMNKADIGIINTCAFIEDAKKESIDAILDLLELKKEGRLERVIVYGCLSQRYKEQLSREFPEVDAFVGRVSLNHETRRYPLTPAHFAYLKICESCVNNCSFCIIPKIKGRFQSLDMDSVLRKVEGFNKQGVSELNIIGQDITGFGMDLYKRPRLSWLLREILKKATDIDWIRLLYLYPNRISEELLELISSEKKFCKYIDLPIQHINQRILSLMNRDTTKEETIKLIAKIRKIIPGVVLRTSIIAGFPSETEKEFKELLRFLKEVRFERLGAFIYSREENTPAYGFQGQIPEKIKIERFDAIMSLQREVSSEVNSRMIGQIIDVLIDEEENGSYLGRSQYDAPEVDGLVYVRSKQKLKAGDFVKVKINDTLEYDLIGEVVKR